MYVYIVEIYLGCESWNKAKVFAAREDAIAFAKRRIKQLQKQITGVDVGATVRRCKVH